MQKEVVSKEVMQELINKLEEIVNNYCWNLESFTDEDINSFFDGTEEEVTYYKSLIVDSIESTSFLWSSKKIAEEIAKAIIESSKYTNNLIKNMSSIRLKYVTSLPISEISENTIYILKASDSTSKDTLNLYNETNGWTKIGDFTIDLTNYIDRTTYDTDMALKANKTEVLTPDDIKTDITATDLTNGDLLGAKVVKDAIDSKANDSDVVKKTDITTTIDNNSTDEQIASARAVYESKKSGIVGLKCPGNKSPLEFAIENNKVGQILYFYSWENKHTDTIYSFSTYISIGHLDSRDISLISITGDTINSYAVNKFHRGAWLGWEIISKSKIADIDKTAIELTDTTYFEQFDTAVENGYQVKNGICYVNLNIKCNSTAIKGFNIKSGMPKPNFNVVHGTIASFAPKGTEFKKELTFSIGSNGIMALYGGEPGCRYLGTFSYPVAE